MQSDVLDNERLKALYESYESLMVESGYESAFAPDNIPERISPEDGDLWGAIGTACYHLSRYADADQAFQTSLSLNGNHPYCFSGYAILLTTMPNADRENKKRAFQLARQSYGCSWSRRSSPDMMGRCSVALAVSLLNLGRFRLAKHYAKNALILAKSRKIRQQARFVFKSAKAKQSMSHPEISVHKCWNWR